MQRVDRMIGIAAVALGVAMLSACSTSPANSIDGAYSPDKPATPVIVASLPPPPKRAEIPPPAPSPHALWDCGHWGWNGTRYVWSPGRYLERPRPDANWMPGYWQQEAEGWLWVEGRWRS